MFSTKAYGMQITERREMYLTAIFVSFFCVKIKIWKNFGFGRQIFHYSVFQESWYYFVCINTILAFF